MESTNRNTKGRRRRKIEMNEDQLRIFKKVVDERRNIFITGSGGVGKSVLVEKIVSELRDKLGNNGQVAVTASTGKAAFNIHGCTLHSFSGIGLGKEEAEPLAKRVKYNTNSYSRWKKVKALIVDEVSMINGILFDKLEYIARYVRDSTEPFGGIQLVLVGDFLQLPPVSTGPVKEPRVFEAKSWNSCIKEYDKLTSILRQKDDKFIQCLQKIRVGHVDEETTIFLNSLSRELNNDSEVIPVNLYATRNRADIYNYSQLEKINEKQVSFSALDEGTARNSTSILDQCPAPSELTLKKGAQVMLVKNLTNDLVNGTVGIIVDFTDEIEIKYNFKGTTTVKESLPIVRFTLTNRKVFTRVMDRATWETRLPSGQLQASRTQIPLILAWAITIHKSQGQTIERLIVNLDNTFETGQVYVALSRAVDASNLQVKGFNPGSVMSDETSLKFYVENDLL